ncbi:MAG: Rrf2 family transcriptional regulator [Hyphomicrobiaceae bacterium]
MELNTKGRYAVMAMADLAQHSVNGDGDKKVVAAVPLSTVAERQQLSLAYLEQIFLLLRRADLVESARGRSGGYRLKRAANEITVAEIMAAAEEETRMTRCGVKTGACLGDVKCATHGLWHALGRHIDEFLATVTLADIVGGAFNANKRIAEQLNAMIPDTVDNKEAQKS